MAENKKYFLPPENIVTKDGSILLGVEETDNPRGVEKLTDLDDIDFSPLKEPKVWYIYILWYVPNKEKKFTFIPIKDPRYKVE